MTALLLAIALVSGVGVPQVQLGDAPAAIAAAVVPPDLPEVPAAETVKARQVVFAEAKPDTACDLVAFYAERRFLSGPWSALRRLEAARRRGDADEAERMEALFDRLLSEAFDAEGEGDGR